MGMNYGFFDAKGFRRRLQGLTDDELITRGKKGRLHIGLYGLNPSKVT